MADLKKLQLAARGLGILYVEDNEKLRSKAYVILKKVFGKVDLVEDEKKALKMFEKYHYPIVVVDINMPKVAGMLLSKHIRNINQDTKIIIISAFDEKEILLKWIEIGIFRFLKKPVKLDSVVDAFLRAIAEINQQQRKKLFYGYLQNIFNYQSSMVVMLNQTRPILANNIFLDVFGVNSIDEFIQKYTSISSTFLPHDGFLYNHLNGECLDILQTNENKLFHVKIEDKTGGIRHLIMKYQDIPEKDGYGILSFDDVTELNLLALFDSKQSQYDEKMQNKKAMFDLFRVIQRNSAKIEIHNYYKGLSITNDGVVAEVNKDTITIKTTYLQQKAIQYEGRAFLLSEALPEAVECTKVNKIGFEKQIVEFESLKFVKSSPVQRKTVRVTPEDTHSVSVFLKESKIYGDVKIKDLSLDGVRLSLDALPAGMEYGTEVTLDIVLTMDKKPLIINTQAKMLKKIELKHSFDVVFVFEGLKKSDLVKYITKRQMAIIREFKGLQNG